MESIPDTNDILDIDKALDAWQQLNVDRYSCDINLQNAIQKLKMDNIHLKLRIKELETELVSTSDSSGFLAKIVNWYEIETRYLIDDAEMIWYKFLSENPSSYDNPPKFWPAGHLVYRLSKFNTRDERLRLDKIHGRDPSHIYAESNRENTQTYTIEELNKLLR